MIRFKKTLSVIVAAVILLCVFVIAPITTNAYTSGDYEYTIDNNGKAVITKYNGKASSVTTPKKLGGKKVTAIGSCAFQENNYIQQVKISSGVTTLENYALYGCPILQKVTLPSTIKCINNSVFNSCSLLESINLPSKLKEIGSAAFSGCKFLRKVTIPDSVTKIGSVAFRNCDNLTTIKFSDNIKTLSEFMCVNCKSLKNVTLGKKTEVIERDAFNGCTSLQEISLPSKVKTIGTWAFVDDKSLSSVKLNSNLKEIGHGSFERCSSLGKINFPCGLETIERIAFQNSGLTSVTIPSSVKSIGHAAFYGCENLKSVIMRGINNPDEETTFDSSCFGGCKKLSYVKIGSGVRVISDSLFSYSALENVEIGPNVNTIGTSAFRNNDTLHEITIPDNVLVIKDYAFYDAGLWTLRIGKGLRSIDYNAFKTYNGNVIGSVYYAGSPDDWGLVDKGNWDSSSSTITYNTNSPIDWESDAKLTSTSLSLNAGSSRRIEVTSGIVKKWSSSNKNVSVKNGKITGLKKGNAVVTAVLSGGKKLKCSVAVKTNPKLSKSSATISKGKKLTLKVSGKGTTAKFKTSNKKVASVNSKGVLKALKKGKVTITVNVNGITLKCKVVIK